jgi:hypothetical protein
MQFDEYVTADSTFYTKPDSVFLNQLAYYASYQNNGPANLVFRVLPLTQNISGGQVVTTVDTTLGNEYTADTLALTSVLGTPTTLPQQTQDLFLPINGVQGTGFAIEIQYFGGINDTFELGSFTYGEERATGGYYDYPLPFTQTYFDSTHNFVYDKSKTTGYIRFDTLVSSFDQVSIGGNPVPEFPSYDDLGRLERQWRWDLSMTTYTFITDKSEAEFVGEAAKIGNPYPNPTSPGNTVVLPIESFGNMDLDARVLSTTGQVMWQYSRENMDRGVHKLHIPTEELSSGVYLINVETGGQRTVKRLIVR